MSDEAKTIDLVNQILALFETEISQTIPQSRRAWYRNLSVILGVVGKGILKRVSAAKLAVFAQTAGEDGLQVLADEFDVQREDATKWLGVCSISCNTGSSVAVGQQFTADSTGAYYTCSVGGTESSGTCSFTVRADDTGEAANLGISDTLTPLVPISGMTSTVAEVDTITTYGQDIETADDWRRRILAEVRRSSGGGCAADYRKKAEAVAGVTRAYPYSGKPITWGVYENAYVSFDATDNSINDTGDPNKSGIFDDDRFGILVVGDMVQVIGSAFNDGCFTVESINAAKTKITVTETIITENLGRLVTLRNESQPGEMTIYIRSDDDEADYIPTEALLELVRTGITTNTDGTEWVGLGHSDSCLYIDPITCKALNLTLSNFDCDDTQVDLCKARVTDDLTAWCASREPFVGSCDFEMDRKDIISIGSVAAIMQKTLDAFGASCGSVSIEIGSEIATRWQLEQGETIKLGTISDDDGVWT
jgi:hypothetical protein